MKRITKIRPAPSKAARTQNVACQPARCALRSGQVNLEALWIASGPEGSAYICPEMIGARLIDAT